MPVRILKLRPLLWIAALLILAFAVSLTWERQTYYDDGGLGSLSFAVITLLTWPGELLGLNFFASILLSLLLLVLGDLAIGRVLKQRAVD